MVRYQRTLHVQFDQLGVEAVGVHAQPRHRDRQPEPPRAGASGIEEQHAGAMLDVYEHYRLEPGHPLFALDNVILTPHLAAVTQESRARASVAAADEMLRILRGERPRNLVNPEVLKKALT